MLSLNIEQDKSIQIREKQNAMPLQISKLKTSPRLLVLIELIQ